MRTPAPFPKLAAPKPTSSARLSPARPEAPKSAAIHRTLPAFIRASNDSRPQFCNHLESSQNTVFCVSRAYFKGLVLGALLDGFFSVHREPGLCSHRKTESEQRENDRGTHR